jgi:subtilisin family serine protease
MLSHLFILAAVVGLLPLSLDGRQSTETTAGLVTQPGYSHAEGDGFAVDPEGLVRVIVLLSPDQRENVKLLAELLPTAQIDRRYTYLIQGLALRLEPADLPALRAHPGVQAVYPDARVEAALADSVPLVGAPQVWALADAAGQPATGQGVQVAVLDTGVDYTHPALGGCLGRNCRVTGGYDFVYNDDDPLDDHGHGTHVAGVIAADGLLQGVAPGANLLAYKVLNENGVGYASDVIAGL